MKNLSQHNNEKTGKSQIFEDKPKKNGIACDHCGHELEDINNQLLTSDPPKKEVHCSHCGFQGYRTA